MLKLFSQHSLSNPVHSHRVARVWEQLLGRLPLLILLVAVFGLAPAQLEAATRVVDNQGDMAFTGQFGQAQQASNTVNIDVATIEIQLSKSVDRSSAQPGDNLNYTVVAENTDTATATGIDIEVDGVAARMVIARDTIPANTVFSRLNGNGTLLYHQFGQPPHRYSTIAPAARNIDAVAVGIGQLAPSSRLELQLQVVSSERSSNRIDNVAELFTGNSGKREATANTSFPNQPGVVRFFSDPDNRQATSRTTPGNRVYVTLDAAGCNLKGDTVEQVTLALRTEKSGDEEFYNAVETGPNTGMFKVDQPVTVNSTNQFPVNRGNRIIEADQHDQLIASNNSCESDVVPGSILIDPRGVVFDSRSNQPIAGAVVTLIDIDGDGNGGNPGGPARVFADDGVTPAPSTVTTNAEGLYQFSQVAPSNYRLEITPPGSYLFPSQVAVANLPSGREIDASGSYGGSFRVDEKTGERIIDVPLDLEPGSLFVSITTSESVVNEADIIQVSVSVTNVSGLDLQSTDLGLDLPNGFRLIPNSARLQGNSVDISNGQLPLGAMQNDDNLILTFLMVAGASASNGEIIASASGQTAAAVQVNSNTARAALRVRRLLGESYVIGSVYLDCNSDHLRGEEELGVPGVRLWLEDGSYVVTDAEGRFSIYGLSARTHVLKLDSITLPAESLARSIDFRHAGDGYSRFIDLKAGELHKANFALDCSDSTRKRVIERRIQVADDGRNGVALADQLTLSENRQRDLKRYAATTSNNQGPVSGNSVQPISVNPATDSRVPDARVQFAAPLAKLDLQTWLPQQNNKLAFIGLADGDVLPHERATIRVKGRLGAELRLLINGQPVDSRLLARRATDKAQRLAFWEYVGVLLQAGDNRIQAQLLDGFGNIRRQRDITVRVPGQAAQLHIDSPNLLVANSAEPAALTVRLTDGNGLPVSLRVPVTLETEIGQWQSEDINRTEPGLQLLIENGQATVLLFPPSQPGKGKLRASIGQIETTIELQFAPNLRPLIMVGLVEATIRVGSDSSDNDQHARLFERQLTELSESHDDGKVDFGARGALFVKGRVRGDYLLTLRYDSERDQRDALFRDIEPDRYYPIYGDATRRGFEARSTSPLYLRVDKGNSYLLYGDLVTDANHDKVKLANIRRALTGAQVKYQGKRGHLTAFASQDSTAQVTDEFPAQGVSGPYQLSRGGIRPGSEQVELLTRDRDQPSVIISTRPMTRFSDYVLDPLTGELVFRRAVPSVDSQLNPQSIRVRFEVEGGAGRYWIGGVQGQYEVVPGLTLGGGWFEDRSPVAALRMRHLHASWKLAEKTQLQAEVARSNSQQQGSGSAWRVEMQHRGERLQVQAEVGRVNERFANNSAKIRPGRLESRLRGHWQVKPRSQIFFDGLISRDTQYQGGANMQGEHRQGAQLGWRRDIGENVQLELSGRSTRRRNAAGEFHSSSARARLQASLPGKPDTSIFIEGEQDLKHSDRRQLAVGGHIPLHERSRAYARHEIISSSAGSFSLDDSGNRHNTVFGLESDYSDSGHAFSEYRSRSAISGRDAETAVGLRNQWQLTDNLSVNGAFERITPVSGDGQQRTAAGVGAQINGNGRWNASARLDWRQTESGNSYFSTLGVSNRINQNWTTLVRNTLQVNRNDVTTVDERLQFGVAYRDTADDRLHALARVELRLQDNETRRNQAELFVLHANYQARANLTLSGSYGIRRVRHEDPSIRANTDAQALHSRATWRAAERWDIGMQAAVLGTDGFDAREYGFGVEFGYLVHSNLWVASGYNLTGFDDPDFGGDATRKGAFIRMRVKFDEQLFGGQP